MTLIAVLILFPAQSLGPWQPDGEILAGRAGVVAVATDSRDPGPAAVTSDPGAIDECTGRERADDDGPEPLLDGPARIRPCSCDTPPSRRCRPPMIRPPFLSPRHLRC